jgi:hypothetical protein
MMDLRIHLESLSLSYISESHNVEFAHSRVSGLDFDGRIRSRHHKKASNGQAQDENLATRNIFLIAGLYRTPVSLETSI